MGAAWSLQGLGASARSRLVAIGDIGDKIDIVNPRLTDESYPKPETVRRPINHGDRPRCLDLSTRSATTLVSGRVGGRGATVARSRASFCFSLGSFFLRPRSHLHLREFQTFRVNLGAFTVEWEVGRHKTPYCQNTSHQRRSPLER